MNDSTAHELPCSIPPVFMGGKCSHRKEIRQDIRLNTIISETCHFSVVARTAHRVKQIDTG